MDAVRRFLDGAPHAVVGASRNRDKFGNKVLRAYRQVGRPVYAVNPHARTVEGQAAWPELSALPEKPHGVSIVTRPEVTEGIVEEAIRLGIENVWMQPGAESAAAVRRAEQAGLNVLHSGPCILIDLGFREE